MIKKRARAASSSSSTSEYDSDNECIETIKKVAVSNGKQENSVLKIKEKKRDEKAETKKGVSFSEKVETHTIGDRSWNDFKTNPNFKKGVFTKNEADTLLQALCGYAH